MLSRVIEVHHRGGYRLFLHFADGASGELDLSPLLHFNGLLAPLRDEPYFAQVRIDSESGTIVWPNGVDLCPDVLRHHVTGDSLPGRQGSADAH